MTLDDRAIFERRDPHGVRHILGTFPAQCRDALRLEPRPAVSVTAPRLVIVAGMGGSAAGGDLLAACAADRLEVPVVVHRGYGLPKIAREGTLVIAASYSGDTAEVLSAVDVALTRRLPVVILSAGGRLAELAAARDLPRIALPPGLMPRLALGYLFLPSLEVLRSVGLPMGTGVEIAEAIDSLDALASEVGPERPVAENEAKRLALAVGRKLPAVYGGPVTGPVAYRWKTDFEETAKAFAIAGTLPEMNHNEIEAWHGPGARRMHAVLLRDRSEPPEVAHRFAILRDLISPVTDGVSEAWARGHGCLARLLSLTYMGQWTSYYLAVLRGADPWSVPLLDAMKRKLGSAS